MAAWHVLFLCLLVVPRSLQADVVAALDDEVCLLQTKVNTNTRRHQTETRDSEADDFDESDEDDTDESEELDKSDESDESRESEEDEEDGEKDEDLGKADLDETGEEDESEDSDNSARSNEYEKLGDLDIGETVPQFVIDLDLPPEKRFVKVAEHFKPQLLAMYHTVYNHSVGNHSLAEDPLALEMEKGALLSRGPEDPTYTAELDSIANTVGIPNYHIRGQQLGSAFQTMKGPFFAYLHMQGKPIPSDEKMLKTMTDPNFMKQFPSFGCTGILAKDSKDGSVWHARNLDFGFARWLQPMTYNAVFKRNGTELFTGQMIFPLHQVLTAIRRGPNGYSYEYNTRFSDTMQDTQKLMTNLFVEKRPLSSWVIRKALEEKDNYDSFLEAVSNTPLPSKEYAIVAGVKKGAVVARDPDGVAYKMELDEKTPYIIMTNFDYKNEHGVGLDDPKEWIPTYRQKGVSGRVRAQNMLKDQQITPELLKKVMTDKDVAVDDTIYHALMNVEHDSFKSSLPHCTVCDCDSEDCVPMEKKSFT